MLKRSESAAAILGEKDLKAGICSFLKPLILTESGTPSLLTLHTQRAVHALLHAKSALPTKIHEKRIMTSEKKCEKREG